MSIRTEFTAEENKRDLEYWQKVAVDLGYTPEDVTMDEDGNTYFSQKLGEVIEELFEKCLKNAKTLSDDEIKEFEKKEKAGRVRSFYIRKDDNEDDSICSESEQNDEDEGEKVIIPVSELIYLRDKHSHSQELVEELLKSYRYEYKLVYDGSKKEDKGDEDEKADSDK